MTAGKPHNRKRGQEEKFIQSGEVVEVDNERNAVFFAIAAVDLRALLPTSHFVCAERVNAFKTRSKYRTIEQAVERSRRQTRAWEVGVF